VSRENEKFWISIFLLPTVKNHFTLILFCTGLFFFFFTGSFAFRNFPQTVKCTNCIACSNITGIHNKIIETFKSRATKQLAKAYILYYVPLKCIYIITENTLQTNSTVILLRSCCRVLLRRSKEHYIVYLFIPMSIYYII